MSVKMLLLVTTIVTFSLFTYALAQESRIPRIGILARYREKSPVRTGLVEGLKDLGYRQGENIHLEIPRTKPYGVLPEIAKRYALERFNAIVTIGSKETAIARNATDEIPIVFVPSRDPVRAGFVKSLAFPGTNLTGLTHVNVEFAGKQLEIFKAAVPALERLAVLYDNSSETLTNPASLAFLRKTAGRLDLKLTEKPVRSIDQAIKTVFSLSRDDIDGIFIVSTNLFAIIEEIPRFARNNKLPLFGGPTLARKFGALMAYTPDLNRIGYRGAWYVDRIIKGAHPRDLPVEGPTHFRLIINLETAHEIGIEIPPKVLVLADEIIR